MPENKWDKYAVQDDSASKWDKYAATDSTPTQLAPSHEPIGVLAPKQPNSPYLKGLDFKSVTDAIKADKTQQNQDSGWLGHTWNNVVNSAKHAVQGYARAGLSTAAEVANAIPGVNTGLNYNQRQGLARAIGEEVGNKINNAKVPESPEAEQKYGFDVNKGVAHNLKAVAASLPSLGVDLGLASVTGGTSWYAQGIGSAMDELKNNPEADKLTEGQKLGYAATSGIVNGMLMKLQFDKIFKSTGLTSLVSKKLTGEVIDELASKGIKATEKDIQDLVAQKATSFMNKAKNVGVKAAIGGGTGAAIGGIQSASNDAIKYLTNKVAGKEIFNEEDLKENIGHNLLNSMAQGSAVGGLLGGVHGAFENTNKAIRSKIAEAQSPEDIAKLQQQINEQVESGNITPEEADAANIKIQDYAQIAAKIPEEVSPDRKYAIIGGIEQREALKNSINDAQTTLNNTDEAFRPQQSAHVDLLRGKLEQTHDYINSLVTGETPKYIEENGLHYKEVNGEKIPITKEHYDAGKLVEDNINDETAAKVEEPKQPETQSEQGVDVPRESSEDKTYYMGGNNTKAQGEGVQYLTDNRDYAAFYQHGTEKAQNTHLQDLVDLKEPTKPLKIEADTPEDINAIEEINKNLADEHKIEIVSKEEADKRNAQNEKKYQQDLENYNAKKKDLQEKADNYLSPSKVSGKSFDLGIDFAKDDSNAIFQKLKQHGITTENKGGNFLDNYHEELKKYAKENGIDYYDGIKGGIHGSLNESPSEILVINKDAVSGKNKPKQPIEDNTPHEVNTQLAEDQFEQPQGEEPTKEGRNVVTLNGATEEERQADIERRKKQTSVTDEVQKTNSLVQDVKTFYDKPATYRNSAAGRAELNNLKLRAGENGHVVKDGKLQKPGKNGRLREVTYNNKADGETAINPNGKPLMERSPEVAQAFESLIESGNEKLEVKTQDGKKMSDEQLAGAIQDVMDGIHSNRATAYLDALEEGLKTKDKLMPVRDAYGEVVGVPLDDMLGVKKEHGEALPEHEVDNWLNDESNLTPEGEQLLHDNIDNILEEHGQESDKTGMGEPNANPEAKGSAEGEHTSEVKGGENVEGQSGAAEPTPEQPSVAESGSKTNGDTESQQPDLETQRQTELSKAGKLDFKLEFPTKQQMLHLDVKTRDEILSERGKVKSAYDILKELNNCI